MGEQRQFEMQLGFAPAADLRRIETDRAGIMQRLRVDDFERVLERSGEADIDGQPFGALAEIAQLRSEPPVILRPFTLPPVGMNTRRCPANVAVPSTLWAGGSPSK